MSGKKQQRENEKAFASDGLIMSIKEGDHAADSRYNHAGARTGRGQNSKSNIGSECLHDSRRCHVETHY